MVAAFRSSSSFLVRRLVKIFATVVVATLAGPLAGACTLNTASPSVTICTPAANSTVSSPVQITAGTTDTKTVKLMQVYVDGVLKYHVAANSVNTSLAMAAGKHRLTVQAYDGSYFKQTI